MNSNILSTRRMALLSAGATLIGATAAFGAVPGGKVAISSSLALPLGSSGLTQGLVGTVWHVPLSGGAGSGQYGIPSPFNTPPVYANVANVETYINSGSYTSSTSGAAYTLPSASETFLNTANTFNYNGGSAPTFAYLGTDASGAAKYDANRWYSSIVDQMGYIKVASAGTYTFTMSAADDAAEVFVGGTGITPSGNAGTGTPVVALGYDSNFSPPPAGAIPSSYGTASVSFSSAGYYPIEIMNYQQGGGANLKFSATGASGAAATYYTTTAMANSVTSIPVPTVATPPTPTDEWNFGKSTITGSTVSDIGTAASAATAGTIVGTGNSVTGGALVTTSTAPGNGMSVPGSTFANYTGSFTLAVTFNRSANDPTNLWGSVMSFGTQGAKGSASYIIAQPQRQDGSNHSSVAINSSGQAGPLLYAANGKPAPAGQLTQDVLVYDASTQVASLYVNGVLQMFGTPAMIPIINTAGKTTGYTPFSFAALADPSGAAAADGLGGLDPFSDPTTLASYYDLSTWNQALTANQVDGLFSVSAVPEPAAIALLGIGAMGMLLLRKRRHA
jgi:hypothetical protein